MPISNKIIKDSFENFRENKDSDHRYYSYDYCFGYFKSFKNKRDIANDKNIETSCLQLGFYLASWGMLRASSILLQKSLPFYKNIIKTIAEDCDDIWNIDVPNYMENDNINKLVKLHDLLASNIPDNHRTIVIVTKIMLGVFGCCPAFDDYFSGTFRKHYGEESRFRRFNKESLETIYSFYDSNKQLINKFSKNTNFISFKTGKSTNYIYSRAKVIDMIGFQLGLEQAIKEKEELQKNKKNRNK